jgi:hypothetical protein
MYLDRRACQSEDHQLIHAVEGEPENMGATSPAPCPFVELATSLMNSPISVNA